MDNVVDLQGQTISASNSKRDYGTSLQASLNSGMLSTLSAPPRKRKSTKIRRKVASAGIVSLAPEIWAAMREIAAMEQCRIKDLIELIKVKKHEHTSLSDAVGVFAMLYFRSAATDEGHVRAGHGNFEWMKARARLDEAN